MTDPADRAEESQPGALEQAAGERLGIERWDRAQIFRDMAEAGTDNDLVYWLVLALSGAIATLGLAMGSSAVVIGAMLVAPLLAPVLGLSLSLAVGDGRLALQAGAVVAGSTLAVVATAALLTLILPFQSVTPEIASRTRPTTLDLAVAICSGLVGALVTVARGSRLSAAIPGVAVAVALIPPLAAGGFGIGIGWRTDIILGSMLLYGANLAGIVLSGMAVFMLIGMHRGDVLEAARDWQNRARTNGLARAVFRFAWTRRVGVFGSAWGRAGLVLVFVTALAIPLTASVRQVAREVRVQRAIGEAEVLLAEPGQTSVLGRTLTFGDGTTRAHIRVATAIWVDEARQRGFETRATAGAGEPIRLVLEQLPATAGGIEELAGILPGRSPTPSPDALEPLTELVERSRELLGRSAADLPFPAGAEAAGAVLVVPPGGVAGAEIAYLAPDSLATQAGDVLTRALRDAVGDPELRVDFVYLGTPERIFDDGVATADSLVALLRRYPGLALELRVGQGVDSVAVAAALASLERAGVDSARAALRTDAGDGLRIRLRRLN